MQLNNPIQVTGAGATPVFQPTTSSSEGLSGVLASVGAATNLVSTGMSLITSQAKLDASNAAAQQTADASKAAGKFVQKYQRSIQTLGSSKAITQGAKDFADYQATLAPGVREQFVKNVVAQLGYAPINKEVNEQLKLQDAQDEKDRQDRNTAMDIVMAGANQNDPNSVKHAWNTAQNLSPEQVQFIIHSNKAEHLQLQDEMSRLDLETKQDASHTLKRNRAQRIVTTSITANFKQMAAGMEAQLEQAVNAGDSSAIMQVQKNALQTLQGFESSLNEGAIKALKDAGYNDIDTTALNAQLTGLRSQITNLRTYLNTTDLYNAKTGALRLTMLNALHTTSQVKGEEGRLATTILSDMINKTNYAQNMIEKFASSDVLHNALLSNGAKPEGGNDDAFTFANRSIALGAVGAMKNFDNETPNRKVMVDTAAQNQVQGLRVGMDRDEEHRAFLAKGVVANWQEAINKNPDATKPSVFEPILNFLADPKNAAAYKNALSGDKDLFLGSTMEYVKSTVMPSLSLELGKNPKEVNDSFNVVIQDGMFRLTPKDAEQPDYVPLGASSFSTMRSLNINTRVKAAKSARAVENVYNKFISAYCNLYGMKRDTAIQIFAEQYAKNIGVELINKDDSITPNEAE